MSIAIAADASKMFSKVICELLNGQAIEQSLKLQFGIHNHINLTFKFKQIQFFMSIEVSQAEYQELIDVVNYDSLTEKYCRGKIEFYCGQQSISFQIIYVTELRNSKMIVLDIHRNLTS
jgi:hypothetical protein